MKRVCAWCNAFLGKIKCADQPADAITHGVCDACQARLLSAVGGSLQQFLDHLGVPVLLIDSDSRVKGANKYSREILGKELPEIEGGLIGDAFSCPNARLPGGCGNTRYCKECPVRNAVLRTFSSGKSIVGERSYPNIVRPGKTESMCCLISTEKRGKVVLLRIDEFREDRPASRP